MMDGKQKKKKSSASMLQNEINDCFSKSRDEPDRTELNERRCQDAKREIGRLKLLLNNTLDDIDVLNMKLPLTRQQNELLRQQHDNDLADYATMQQLTAITIKQQEDDRNKQQQMILDWQKNLDHAHIITSDAIHQLMSAPWAVEKQRRLQRLNEQQQRIDAINAHIAALDARAVKKRAYLDRQRLLPFPMFVKKLATNVLTMNKLKDRVCAEEVRHQQLIEARQMHATSQKRRRRNIEKDVETEKKKKTADARSYPQQSIDDENLEEQSVDDVGTSDLQRSPLRDDGAQQEESDSAFIDGEMDSHDAVSTSLIADAVQSQPPQPAILCTPVFDQQRPPLQPLTPIPMRTKPQQLPAPTHPTTADTDDSTHFAMLLPPPPRLDIHQSNGLQESNDATDQLFVPFDQSVDADDSDVFAIDGDSERNEPTAVESRKKQKMNDGTAVNSDANVNKKSPAMGVVDSLDQSDAGNFFMFDNNGDEDDDSGTIAFARPRAPPPSSSKAATDDTLTPAVGKKKPGGGFGFMFGNSAADDESGETDASTDNGRIPFSVFGF